MTASVAIVLPAGHLPPACLVGTAPTAGRTARPTDSGGGAHSPAFPDPREPHPSSAGSPLVAGWGATGARPGRSPLSFGPGSTRKAGAPSERTGGCLYPLAAHPSGAFAGRSRRQTRRPTYISLACGYGVVPSGSVLPRWPQAGGAHTRKQPAARGDGLKGLHAEHVKGQETDAS